MKILEISEWLFVQLGIIFVDSTCFSLIRAYVVNFLYLATLGFIAPAFFGMYCYHYLHGDVEEALLGFNGFNGSLVSCVQYFLLVLNRQKLMDLVESVQQLVDKGH